ncbi:hypothetical protein BMR08_16375 [Methylococcaceae bacterium CS2]|nr:hypothetical protein BMR08_16375 [Methylococcaceae bacterium CS2]
MLRSQHRVYDGSGEVARTQDVWGAEGISGRVKFLVLSQKTNVCVKINCNLFLCDEWMKHHAGKKYSRPIAIIERISQM